MDDIGHPFYYSDLTLIPASMSNYMPDKVWDENTYRFPNFNGCNVEVWDWISNFISHFMMVNYFFNAQAWFV